MVPWLFHHWTISFAPRTRPSSQALCGHCPHFLSPGSPDEAEDTQAEPGPQMGRQGSRQGTWGLEGLPPPLEPWQTHGGAVGPFLLSLEGRTH